jgi:tRNA dimethylallyltransferase
MKQIAIIGPTASGKSDLAIEAALRHNAYILSIDSLSIYKEIDIASAKPAAGALEKVKHFGINEIYPDAHFSVAIFIELYHKARRQAQEAGKNLIIVGGTSFYLKSLTTGLSALPEYSRQTKERTAKMLLDPQKAYAYLQQRDPLYMQGIEPTDAYRIEKMLLLALESGMSPTEWFNTHPAKPVIEAVAIFDIAVERALLRERIILRTRKMAESGLIDEVAMLEQKYGRDHNAMKAIGVIEVLAFLDGEYSKEEMIDNIITHTAQLAKRQQTFNRTQFGEAVSAELETLPQLIANVFV